MATLVLFSTGMTWLFVYSLFAGRIKIPSTYWLLYFVTLLTAIGDFRAWIWASNLSEAARRALHGFSNTFLLIPGLVAGIHFMKNPASVASSIQKSYITLALRRLGPARIIDANDEVRRVRQFGVFLFLFNSSCLVLLATITLILDLPALNW